MMLSFQSNNYALNVVPSCFDEAWSLVWDLKTKFLARNGSCELNRYEKHLKNVIGSLSLEKISPLLLEQLKAEYLSQRMRAKTICHVLGLIGQVFNYLIQLGLYQGTNPASKIKMPKEDNSRHRYLTREEASLLLDHLKSKSHQIWQISLLSLGTGMRAGEIFSLRGEHVNLEDKTIRIVDPKSGKNRTVYPPNAVIEMLQRCHLKSGRYVFTTKYGNRIKEVSNTFARAVNELGFNDNLTDLRDKVVFHSLRHTFASWMVQCDQPLYMVAELLGHSTLEMTKRYAHLSPQRQQAATSILDGYL